MEILPQNPKKHKVKNYPEGRNHRPIPVVPTQPAPTPTPEPAPAPSGDEA